MYTKQDKLRIYKAIEISVEQYKTGSMARKDIFFIKKRIKNIFKNSLKTKIGVDRLIEMLTNICNDAKSFARRLKEKSEYLKGMLSYRIQAATKEIPPTPELLERMCDEIHNEICKNIIETSSQESDPVEMYEQMLDRMEITTKEEEPPSPEINLN